MKCISIARPIVLAASVVANLLKEKVHSAKDPPIASRAFVAVQVPADSGPGPTQQHMHQHNSEWKPFVGTYEYLQKTCNRCSATAKQNSPILSISFTVLSGTIAICPHYSFHVFLQELVKEILLFFQA